MVGCFLSSWHYVWEILLFTLRVRLNYGKVPASRNSYVPRVNELLKWKKLWRFIRPELQRSIQKPVKHVRWSFLRKTLLLRWWTGFWICLRSTSRNCRLLQLLLLSPIQHLSNHILRTCLFITIASTSWMTLNQGSWTDSMCLVKSLWRLVIYPCSLGKFEKLNLWDSNTFTDFKRSFSN